MAQTTCRIPACLEPGLNRFSGLLIAEHLTPPGNPLRPAGGTLVPMPTCFVVVPALPSAAHDDTDQPPIVVIYSPERVNNLAILKSSFGIGLTFLVQWVEQPATQRPGATP